MLLKGDKECWRKVKYAFKRDGESSNTSIIVDKSIQDYSHEGIVELFTIGLFEEYRGFSYGKDLILAFFDVCKSIKRKVCLISYIKENFRAERFYYKHGCKPYLEKGDSKICYKLL